MKELTIEQKAQRYDEAIAIAMEINNEQRAQPFNVMTRVFPELKESDDERIRKEIVSAINIYCSEYHRGTKVRNDMLSWLEKQGQVKESVISQHENKTCKENGNSLTSEDIRSGLIQYFSTFTLDTFAGLDPKKILAWLEAQGEQKPQRMVSAEAKEAMTALSELEIGKLLEIEKQAEQKKELLQELDDKLNNALENETPESLGKFLNEQKSADKVEQKFHEGEWVVIKQ